MNIEIADLVNLLPKKTHIKPVNTNTKNRETKIMNVMCNTSIILMSTFMEAFSDVFTKMATEMTHALTASLGAPEETTKEMNGKMDNLITELPKQLIEQIVTMKADINKQLYEKKQDIEKMIADPKFDQGITISETYDFGMPQLTQDLDELTLLKYIALVKANNPQCTTMLQELMEWMKNVPQVK